MPNWVENRIKIEGSDIKEKMERYFSKTGNAVYLNFENIKPMPSSLNIERSFESFKGLSLFVNLSNPDVSVKNPYVPKLDKPTFDKFIKSLSKSIGNKTIEKLKLSNYEILELLKSNNHSDLLKTGKTIYHNLMTYGFTDWYDWRLENWGCKWNACETVALDDYSEFTFLTPWSPSDPIVKELSKQNPSLLFVYDYCEENEGSMAGSMVFKNGVCLQDNTCIPYSTEAYKKYSELWA